MDMISKKELLALTGISYGQLYRWKRQGLIPEEWFIKRSAYTGQETFFPREQILSRIRTIQDAKDDYSLEQLSRLLNPRNTPGFCTVEELGELRGVDGAVVPLVPMVRGEDPCEFWEAVVVSAVSAARRELELSSEDTLTVLTLALSAGRTLPDPTGTTLTLFRTGEEGELHLLFVRSAVPLALDPGLRVLGSWDLGQLAGAIKLNYQKGRI